jgi:hypothetical protein
MYENVGSGSGISAKGNSGWIATKEKQLYKGVVIAVWMGS